MSVPFEVDVAVRAEVSEDVCGDAIRKNNQGDIQPAGYFRVGVSDYRICSVS